jgi:hypothetical protein
VPVQWFRRTKGVNGQSPLPEFPPRWFAGVGHGWRLRFAAVAHRGLRACALVPAHQRCKRTVAATGIPAKLVRRGQARMATAVCGGAHRGLRARSLIAAHRGPRRTVAAWVRRFTISGETGPHIDYSRSTDHPRCALGPRFFRDRLLGKTCRVLRPRL